MCPSFLSILIDEFRLNVEGFTDARQNSKAFEFWCSESSSDRAFGSIGDFFQCQLIGKNTFAFPNVESPTRIRAVLDHVGNVLQSKQPSRVLIILPSHIEHKFIVVARLGE